MFGTGEVFKYYVCDNCNCIQISEPPEDLKLYYPETYYTYSDSVFKTGKVKKIFYKIRSLIALTGIYEFSGFLKRKTITDMIHYGRIKFSERILDVGCGDGRLLGDFFNYGFKNLLGIDPFLKKEKNEGPVKLLKKGIFDESGMYDVIIFNHSFEHVLEQKQILLKSVQLLSERGRIIIRMPVVNYAFEKYRENWIQIDAPRHLIIHSLRSFRILCDGCNLKTEKIIFDSTEFQFIGSEQLLQGINLTDENSYYTNSSNSKFTDKDVKIYRRNAKDLNRKSLGDQAMFFIRKI